MRSFKSVSITVFRLLLISVFIGIFVALFQFLSFQLGAFLKDVFINKVLWKVIAFFIVFPLIIYYAYHSVNYNKNIIGGGIPALEYNLLYRRDKLNGKKDLIMMMFSALLTTCTYACLGTVLATSVVMGGNIPLLINEYFKVEDDDSVNIGMGAAFGAMLLHPLPGIVYCFEEALKKFNIKLLIKSIFMCLIAFGVTYLLYDYKTFAINIEGYLGLNHWYIFIIIQIAAFIFSTLFAICILKVKDFAIKHSKNFFIKYRLVLSFIVFTILAFFIGNYMGSGVGFIKLIFNETTWYLVLGLVLFRFVFTILGVNSSATGGVIIPIFAVGAAFEMALTLFLNNFFALDMIYAGEIVLLSILTFYVSSIETPFIGVALLFAFVGFKESLILFIPTLFMMILASLITKLNKYGDVYDLLKRYFK